MSLNTSLEQLRSLRKKSAFNLIQKKQATQLSLTGFSNKKQRITITLPVVMALIAYLYSDLHHFRMALSFSFAVQITIVTLCSLIAAPIYFAILKKQPIKLSRRLTFLAALSIMMAYATILLALFSPYAYKINQHLFPVSTLPYSVLSRQSIGFWLTVFSKKLYLCWSRYTLLYTFQFLIYNALLYQFVSSKPPKRFNLWIGRATGFFYRRHHSTGLSSKAQVGLSLDDATQNILILGGTGSGKTTKMMHPLLLQLLDQQCGGLIFDIKGDFKVAVEQCAIATSSNKLQIIGKGGIALNLIQGLQPELAASFLRSSLAGANRGQLDGFWIETATQLCQSVLGILSFLPRYYALNHVYHYLFDEQERAVFNERIKQLPDLDREQQRRLAGYVHYHDNVFSLFDEKVRTGVLASVSQILSPFQHPTLIDLFCQPNQFSLLEVLEGTLFLVDLPLSVWGTGAKVAYNFIKLRFFNLMQQRATHPDWNQIQPVFFMCDEYQEIISAHTEGLSDLSFWDKSRSSKTIGIISSQSVSSFYAAIGNHDVTHTILQNFRQKVCFRTEDQATLELLNRVTGQVDVIKYTMSQQQGSSTTHLFHGQQSRSQTKGQAYTQRPIIDAQLMRNLQADQAIALLSISNLSCDDILTTMPVFIE